MPSIHPSPTVNPSVRLKAMRRFRFRTIVPLKLLLLMAVVFGETILSGRRAVHTHEVHILTSLLSEANVALTECFFEASGNEAAEHGAAAPVAQAWQDVRDHCCRAIAASSFHVIERSRVLPECQARAVPLPDVTIANISLSQRQPKLLFVEDHSLDTVPDLNGSVWTHFHWDDVIQLGFWLAPHDAEPKTAFLQRISDRDGGPTMFEARIDSNLDAEGGMHRLMRHTIHVELPAPTAGAPSSNDYDTSLAVRLLLPPDVFVLVNDAVELEDTVAWKTALHTVPHRVLSEEEASFKSPPHAVLIHLQGRLSGNNASSLIRFATKLHFRYPRPSTDSSRMHQTVAILAPELVAGELRPVAHTAADGGGGGAGTYHLRPPGHIRRTTTRDYAPIVYGHVAAPLQSDLGPVLTATVAASLLGAAVVGREIVRAATWV